MAARHPSGPAGGEAHAVQHPPHRHRDGRTDPSSPWRTALLSLLAIYLLVRLLAFTKLFADLLHLLPLFGGYGYATWQGRDVEGRDSSQGQGKIHSLPVISHAPE